MRKLTVETYDSNVYDMEKICRYLSDSYDWSSHSIQKDGSVRFSMDGEEFVGEMIGYEFQYCDKEGNPEGLLDWLESCDADNAIRAKDENGNDVFILIG